MATMRVCLLAYTPGQTDKDKTNPGFQISHFLRTEKCQITNQMS